MQFGDKKPSKRHAFQVVQVGGVKGSTLLKQTEIEMVHPVSEANEKSLFGSLTQSEFYARHSVSHSSEYIINSRGLKLFTQCWVPLPPMKIIGTLAVIHGFTGQSSWFIQLTSVHLAKAGFATCAIDHQGHGYSEGLVSHIPDINVIVDDCISFFDSFRAKYPPLLPTFLYSESLGGAIGLLIFLRRRDTPPWNGLILSGAMCGINPKFVPPWPLEYLLSLAAWMIPTWQVIPTRPVPVSVFKEDWKSKLALACPRSGVSQPTIATAKELLRVCRELQKRMEEVEVPFLIVHGEDDMVCDPTCVKELYERAGSKDKTIRVYPGMWHQLVGEPMENVELVFGQVVEWLRTRAEQSAITSNLLPE